MFSLVNYVVMAFFLRALILIIINFNFNFNFLSTGREIVWEERFRYDMTDLVLSGMLNQSVSRNGSQFVLQSVIVRRHFREVAVLSQRPHHRALPCLVRRAAAVRLIVPSLTTSRHTSITFSVGRPAAAAAALEA